MSNEEMTLASGARLGSYDIVAPVGAGCMGDVYRARQRRITIGKAVKLFRPRRSQRSRGYHRGNHIDGCVRQNAGGRGAI
jgi:hypothetical protein